MSMLGWKLPRLPKFISWSLLYALCAAAPAKADFEDHDIIAAGRVVAERKCVACHTDNGKESDKSQSIPLAQILTRYSQEELAKELKVNLNFYHLTVGPVDLSVSDSATLLAYLTYIAAENYE